MVRINDDEVMEVCGRDTTCKVFRQGWEVICLQLESYKAVLSIMIGLAPMQAW